MGAKGSTPLPVEMTAELEQRGAAGGGDEMYNDNVPDRALSANYSTPEEDARKRREYANIKPTLPKKSGKAHDAAATNTIEQVYNDDFETIDHIQAMRFPPLVARQLHGALRGECERRCGESEKTMARCLQDKMWTSWKCQKLRDAYFYCVEEVERRAQRPAGADAEEAAAAAAEIAANGGVAPPPSRVKNTIVTDEVTVVMREDGTREVTLADSVQDLGNDVLSAFRWKYNLGVFHSEMIGRNNLMRKIWADHFPERELPHPWVKEEYK